MKRFWINGILILLVIVTVVSGFCYGDAMTEEQTYEYWSHHNVAEFIDVPVKAGDIVQSFTAGFDHMNQFILLFDNYSTEDEAVVTVTLEDAKGELYYSWSCCPAYFSGEVFCLLANVEKELNSNQEYYIRVSLDSPASDITVRIISEEEIHKSVGNLTIAGEEQEERVLYFFQSYQLQVSYTALWFWGLLITVLLFLLVTLCKREWALRVGRLISLVLLPGVCYYNLESLSGNIQTISMGYVLVNCLIILGLYLVLRAVFSRGAYYMTAIMLFIVALANYYVLQFKGTELLLSDIGSIPTAISVMGNYVFTVPPVVFSAILFTGCLFFLQGVMDARGKFTYRKPKISERVAFLAVGIVVLASVVISAGMSLKQDEKAVDLFVISKNFSKYGWCYSNVFLLETSSVKRPSHYSDRQVEKILSELSAKEEEKTTEIVPQNIIVIMNESLSDLSVVGNLETNEAYMPFLHSLTENTVKGNLHVSTFGGYTCITEYEFLTGNSQHFLPTGSKPYTTDICREEEAGLTRNLQAQGYYAVAMHPYGPENWERASVYPAMGFDEFLSLEDYEGYEKLRNYISDKGNYQKLIDYYESFDKAEKLFIFNVTMQNHSGYDINGGELEQSIVIENFESAVGETYLSLVKESDEAFAYLLSYFSRVEEPTMIVMFGDHQPALPDSFYERLYGKDMDARSEWEISRQYITPYFIWTNYASDFEEIGDISANYLGSYVMQCAGVELSDYDRFLLEQRRQAPVLGMYGILDVEGNYIPYGQVQDGLLNQYQMLQYMRVEDRASGFYDIFRIEEKNGEK